MSEMLLAFHMELQMISSLGLVSFSYHFYEGFNGLIVHLVKLYSERKTRIYHAFNMKLRIGSNFIFMDMAWVLVNLSEGS